MSCHHLAALLALVGLAFELVAVFLILRSVGVGDPLVRWIKSVRGRLITRIRRLLPWLRNPETIYRDHGVVGKSI